MDILKEIGLLNVKPIDILVDNSIKLLANQEEPSSNPGDIKVSWNAELP